MSRDARAILEQALSGLHHRIAERGGAPLASFPAASAEVPEGAPFVVTAPPGWLHLSTSIPMEGVIPPAGLRSLNLLYAETGFGHVHFDASAPALRLGLALQAVDSAPAKAAVIAAVQHLLLIRRKLLTGQGEVRPTSPVEGEDLPTVDQAADVLGTSLELVPAPKGGFMGGIAVAGRADRYAVRVHEPLAGILAFDAWALPPERWVLDEGRLHQIEAGNASLDAGALIAFPDGVVIYRWSCPRRWLRLDELGPAVLLEQAFSALGSLIPT